MERGGREREGGRWKEDREEGREADGERERKGGSGSVSV